MITNTATKTTEVLAEDRRRVQGIGNNDGGGSGSTTGPADWKQQRNVNFPCYWVANSNTVSSLYSCCLFLIFFYQIPFFVCCKKYYQYCNHAENIFVPSVHQPCVCTPCIQESKKIRVLKINKDVCKSLARKKGNEILIWSWNDPGT